VQQQEDGSISGPGFAIKNSDASVATLSAVEPLTLLDQHFEKLVLVRIERSAARSVTASCMRISCVAHTVVYRRDAPGEVL
jgi:hypothetical protein